MGVIKPCSFRLPKNQFVIKPTFTDEETRKILFCRENKKADIIALLLLTTGIRSSTVRSLTVSDFLPSEKALILRHLKNGKQAIIPLPNITANRLKRYILDNGLSESDLLFSTQNSKQYSRNSLYELMDGYCVRKGFKHKGVHIFRHTYAKLMSKSGCPSITLARCLTHSTIQQSEHYVNLYGLELRTACEKYNPVAFFARRE